MAEAAVVVELPDEAIVAGVASGDARVAEQLGDLCRQEAARSVYSSCVPLLARHLSDPSISPALAHQASRALANLCFEHAANRLALSSDAAALSFLCLPHAPGSELLRCAVGCLANLLSEDDAAGASAVAAGALPALVRALPLQGELARRGLLNAAQKSEWALAAVEIGALEALAKEETGEEVFCALVAHEATAVWAAQQTGLVVTVAKKGWEEALHQMAMSEAACGVLGLSEEVWRETQKMPRLQGLLSGSEEGSARALADRARLMGVLRENAAREGESESEAKERAEKRSGALLALGNAARSEAAVRMVLAEEGLLSLLVSLMAGSLGDQHLATGLLGNLAVPGETRSMLAEAAVARAAAECFSKSHNANVMMNAAVLLRRLALSPSARPLVAAEVSLLLAQRERLTQPEHARIPLELGRIAALCCAEETVSFPPEAHSSLLDLLSADWSVLRVEACRGCALLGPRCDPSLVARLFALLSEAGGEGSTRLAAALALARAAPNDPALRAALQTLETDPTVVDGQPLARVAKQLLESLEKIPVYEPQPPIFDPSSPAYVPKK